MTCPICKKLVDENSAGKPGSTFPFCSDRCKLIDLGRWFNGSYQIPVRDDADESTDESTPGEWRPADGDRPRGRR